MQTENYFRENADTENAGDPIRSLWRMENHVKGFTESMKFIQSCFNLSENERTEQDVTFFNKKVDELADRLKKAFASANS